MFEYFAGNHRWSIAIMRALASGAHFGELDWACRNIREAAAQRPNGDLEA